MEETKNALPLVSIIVPTFNRALVLSETLDSILALTYKNWECIIVDDGSTDNTEEVVQKYMANDSRFSFYHRPEKYKPGANGARNYGFDVSKGEYIQWFDSDDIMLEDFLTQKIDTFIGHPKLDSVISRVTFFEGNRKILKDQFHWGNIRETVYENLIVGYMPIMTQCIIFQKKYLSEIAEKWDESVKRAQELEFISRIMIKHPHQTHFIDKSFALVRRNDEDSKTTQWDDGSSLEMNETTYLVQYKIIELLIQNKKLSQSLIAFFNKENKRLLSIAYQNHQRELALKYKRLIDRCLIYKNDKFDRTKFRLDFAMMKIIPVDNFFVYYKYHPLLHRFNKYIIRNMKRIYKLLFVRGWLSEKRKNAVSIEQKF